MFWKKSGFDYSSEKFQDWKTFESISLKRKLKNETAFDGIVKIYSLESNNLILDSKLKNKFFGEFCYETENGIFLRMFKNKDSWPNTILIFIYFTDFSLIEIKKTDSSWNVWIGLDLGNDKYSIEIKPTEKIIYQVNGG